MPARRTNKHNCVRILLKVTNNELIAILLLFVFRFNAAIITKYRLSHSAINTFSGSVIVGENMLVHIGGFDAYFLIRIGFLGQVE